jgi:hypothetical protein
MCRSLLSLVLMSLLVGVSEAQYSDASLDNAWIFAISEIPDETSVFIIFDGEGGVPEFGAFRMLFPAGTYSVEQSGEFVILVEHEEDGQWEFNGQFLNDSTTTITMGELSFPMVKVTNEAACAGVWAGNFVQDSTQVTYTIEEMVIDEWGEIQSCTGFTPPVTGRFYAEQDYFVGHFFTGEGMGWEEIGIEGGTCIPNQAMNGTFSLECGDCNDGSFTLEYDAVSEPGETVSGFSLCQNHPNPFNPSTTIEYGLAAPGKVHLSVYNISGQIIATLEDGWQGAGQHEVLFDGTGLSSGIYFYALQAGSVSEVKRMLLLK